MKTMWLTKFANAQFLVGVSLLLCALTSYYFAVLRIDYNKTTLLNLAPHPDATEYFAQAKALLMEGPSFRMACVPSREQSSTRTIHLLSIGALRTASIIFSIVFFSL